ncbi:Lrp/AsnC family transcriptional regulator [Oleomonas cavernae]|uniref:Lrp/AsnC family transcriptional regulator n=2 Tax=Oleomonas cavernae TaxID=2320859 RepID=A0A418WIK1_9PROT|nr:Lrp/AsnC family transcriptional regulator [Oleomonas cavernae]
MALDRMDHAILDVLKRDGRMTATELAGRVGLSASACSRRIKRLEDVGVITGYGAAINEAARARGLTVVVFVSLHSQTEEFLSAFERAVQRCENVVEGYLLSGPFDYSLRVLARDVGDYERIHKEQLSRLPGVSRMQSNFALRKVVG